MKYLGLLLILMSVISLHSMDNADNVPADDATGNSTNQYWAVNLPDGHGNFYEVLFPYGIGIWNPHNTNNRRAFETPHC